MQRIGVACLWFLFLGSCGSGIGFAETNGEALKGRVEKLERLLERREREMGELKATVRQLKDEVAAFRQASALVLEPGEELRRITEYVCAQGHIYAEWTEDGLCPLDGTRLVPCEVTKKFKFSRRESVADKIEAAVKEEFARRIVVGASLTGTVQQSLGADEADRAVGVGSADLLFLGQLTPWATLLLDLEAVGGDGLDSLLGTNLKLNEDASSLQSRDKVGRVSLREAWLRWDSLDRLWSATAGKIDLSNYFDSNAVANDETTQFLASSLVNNPVLELPDNGSGAVLQFDSREAFRWGVGVQSSDNSGDQLLDELYGITEVGYHTNAFFGRPGNYRLWGRINGGAPSDNGGSGISIDQQVHPGWTAFGRYGIAEEEGAAVNTAWSIGLEQRAPWRLRPQDRWAVAFAQQDSTTAGRDSLVEWYYRMAISPNLAVSPHLQWLIESAGNADAGPQENVVVVGVRAQTDF